MLIHHPQFGLMPENIGVQGQRAAICFQRAYLLQITQMLRHDRLSMTEQTKSGFPVAAQRNQLGSSLKARRQTQWHGGIATRPTQQTWYACHHLRHRVIQLVDNGAIMQQKSISQAGQLSPGLRVGAALWLATAITASHQQRRIPVSQQQMMQRAVRQHKTQGVLSWRNPVRQLFWPSQGMSSPQQHD